MVFDELSKSNSKSIVTNEAWAQGWISTSSEPISIEDEHGERIFLQTTI